MAEPKSMPGSQTYSKISHEHAYCARDDTRWIVSPPATIPSSFSESQISGINRVYLGVAGPYCIRSCGQLATPRRNRGRFGSAGLSGSLGANAALPDASPPPELWAASSTAKAAEILIAKFRCSLRGDSGGRDRIPSCPTGRLHISAMRKLPVVLICRGAGGLRHTSDTSHIDAVPPR